MVSEFVAVASNEKTEVKCEGLNELAKEVGQLENTVVLLDPKADAGTSFRLDSAKTNVMLKSINRKEVVIFFIIIILYD